MPIDLEMVNQCMKHFTHPIILTRVWGAGRVNILKLCDTFVLPYPIISTTSLSSNFYSPKYVQATLPF